MKKAKNEIPPDTQGPPLHANGVTAIQGFLWAPSNEDESDSLRLLFESTEADQYSSQLAIGQTRLCLATIEERKHEFSAVFGQKKQPFGAVILECESLEKYTEVACPDYFLDFHGKKAAGIHTGPHQWDILAVER